MEDSFLYHIYDNDIPYIQETGVYKIFHLDYPDKFYIGSATYVKGRGCRLGFYNRFYIHYYDLMNNRHKSKYLQNVTNKYGIGGIKFKIIQICRCKQSALFYEQLFLDKLSPAFNTNKCATSSLGFRHSEQTILLLKKQRKGIVPSRESREKAKLTFKINKALGYKRKEFIHKRGEENKTSKRVYYYTKCGAYVGEFCSVTEASKRLKLNNLSHAIKHKSLVGGFQWSYKKQTKVTPALSGVEKISIKKKKKINQFSKSRELIKTWPSAEDAAKQLNISVSAIRNCLCGISKSSGKYIWEHPTEALKMGLSLNRL